MIAGGMGIHHLRRNMGDRPTQQRYARFPEETDRQIGIGAAAEVPAERLLIVGQPDRAA